MKSWKGLSCRKMVRALESERIAAAQGKAWDQEGRRDVRGLVPRTLAEIDADLFTWRSRLAGPEPKPAPVLAPSEIPSCRFCGKKLRPEFELVSRRVETHNLFGFPGYHTVDEPGAIRGFGYGARGHFCSLRCGWGFAVDLLEGKRS